MLACTLNTNAENPASSGRGSPSMSARGVGDGARSTMASRIMRTPKLVSAEPTNTGVESPARNDSGSTSAPMASSSPISSWATSHAVPSSTAATSAGTSSSGDSDAPRSVRVKRV